MREIGAFEAKNTLGNLLDLVAGGEEIVLTRHGKRIARLVPEAGFVNRDKARRAAADMIAASKGVTLGGIPSKALIDDGRP